LPKRLDLAYMFAVTSKLRIAKWLSVALLFAQLGAITHGYSHSLHSPTPHEQSGTRVDLCAQCAAFGSVLSPAGTSHTAALAANSVDCGPAPDHIRRAFGACPRHYFQSQGPPSAPKRV
jgi:hypothetical protein